MKALKTALVIAAVALIAACASSPTTNSDYDPATNFAQYHSFGYMATDPIADPMVDSRIKSAVTAALTAKGWTLNDQNPDVWVVPHVQLSEQTQLNTYNTGWGYGRWGAYGGGTTQTTVEKIPVGTVIIDLVDAEEEADGLARHGEQHDRPERNARAEAGERERGDDAAFREIPARIGSRQVTLSNGAGGEPPVRRPSGAPSPFFRRAYPLRARNARISSKAADGARWPPSKRSCSAEAKRIGEAVLVRRRSSRAGTTRPAASKRGERAWPSRRRSPPARRPSIRRGRLRRSRRRRGRERRAAGFSASR